MSKIKKELLRFLIAGFSAVGTDLVVYYLLSAHFEEALAKGVSFFAGTIVAYIINKYWTFEQKEKSYSEIVKFGILYLTSLAVNVFVNQLILEQFEHKLFAFIIATGTSTCINFVGQKWWVFKH